MVGWLLLYLAIIVGACYTATASELAGNFACEIALFIIAFLSIWTVGRILVNPENKVWAIAMLICNIVAIIYIVIYMVKHK